MSATYGSSTWFSPSRPTGARSQLIDRANRSGLQGVVQSPIAGRPDDHANARNQVQAQGKYGEAYGRGRGGSQGAVGAREESDRRRRATGEVGRPAHTDFLPKGRGRAQRPSTGLPSADPERRPLAPMKDTGKGPALRMPKRVVELVGRIFAGGRGSQ